MADTARRLPPTLPPAGPAYAPIAATAVAALGVAGLFATLLVVLGGLAYTDKKSLIEPWLLFFPPLALVLAFVARRQVRTSEGARTGERYADMARTIALVGGLGYLAYLFAVQFAVRREAGREFAKWASLLTASDPANPHDPKLIAAAYYTLSGEQRKAVPGGENDAVGMERAHQDAILNLQASDLARLCQRQPAGVTITPSGVQKWEQRLTQIDCTLTAFATSAEGEFALVVPMQAGYDDAKQRRWRVLPPKPAYITDRALTPYGWQVAMVEQSAAGFAADLYGILRVPDSSYLAYLTYVKPGETRQSGFKAFAGLAESAPGRAGLVGAAALSPALLPGAAAADDDLARRVFAKPDGTPPGGAELDKFRYVWTQPGRLLAAGTNLKGNPDIHPVTTVAGPVEVNLPAEMVLGTGGQQPPTARARVVLKLPADAEAALLADLARLKAAGGAKTSAPPPEVVEQVRNLPWRVTRLSSDLKQVVVLQPTQPAGGGMPGG